MHLNGGSFIQESHVFESSLHVNNESLSKEHVCFPLSAQIFLL